MVLYFISKINSIEIYIIAPRVWLASQNVRCKFAPNFARRLLSCTCFPLKFIYREDPRTPVSVIINYY